ncbi:MAG: hypothetical protein KatS3mg076_3026 [Candidatus Binatia bacterium]|nr:MAG: hypothetical protein KatS3mg076_3026 [Candidatus Binatia bacterium]
MEPRREPLWVRGGRFAALGLEFGFAVAAGVVVGFYLDRWAGTAPWLTLVFTLAAFAGAVYRLVWALRRFG